MIVNARAGRGGEARPSHNREHAMTHFSEISAILQEGKDVSLATLRTDGWPQATTVSFAADGMEIYFGCAATSQKAANLGHDPRVSGTVTLPYTDWSKIRSISFAGRAARITDPDELARVAMLFFGKFPEVAQYVDTEGGDLAMFRVTCEVISLLDYRRGFGAHVQLSGADLAQAHGGRGEGEGEG